MPHVSCPSCRGSSHYEDVQAIQSISCESCGTALTLIKYGERLIIGPGMSPVSVDVESNDVWTN